MKVKKILLSGDDGYEAVGIRVLVELLKDSYELKIAATKGQRSAIGGGAYSG